MTPDEYVASLQEDRRNAVEAIRAAVNKNLPKGFSESTSYGMMGWVVPYDLYPSGYHTDGQPLPYMGLGSRKNYISLYCMSLYASKELHDWFVSEWPKHAKKKLNMGKSCINLKVDDIPFELIGQLAAKLTPKDWIEIYEKNMKR